MRCDKQPHLTCRSMTVCELTGCAQPYGQPATPPAVARQPIDLVLNTIKASGYQPGWLMRGVMKLTEAGEKAVKRGPTPFAPEPVPEPVPAPLPAPPETEVPMSQSIPEPAPAPPAPPASALRILAVPGAYLVYLGDRPMGLVARVEQLGPVQ